MPNREEAVHPDDRRSRHAALERSIATGAEFDIEYRIIVPERSDAVGP